MISLKPKHLKRYKDLAWLFMKYGRADLVRKAGLEDVVDEKDDEPPTGNATDLASDLERMGPTFIKLGQLLSTRVRSAARRVHGGPCPPPGQCRAVLVRGGRAHRRQRAGSPNLQGLRHLRGHTDGGGVPRPGPPRHPARRAPGRRQGPAAGHPRDACSRTSRPSARSPTSSTPTRRRGRQVGFGRDPRRVPPEPPPRARLPRGGSEPRHPRPEPRASSTASWCPAPIEDYTTPKVLTMTYVRGTKITTLSPVVRLELTAPR